MPKLVHTLSYDPKTEVATPEQQLEFTYAMAERMMKNNRNQKKLFNREHADDTPIAASGQIDELFIRGESLIANIATTDDTAEFIDTGALTELSMSHSMDPNNPEDCTLDEVSLVFTPQRDGSDIIDSHPTTMLRVSASGTVKSTVKLAAETEAKPMEEEEKTEEEVKKAVPFRPRRKNEDVHEYMVKKVGSMPGLSGAQKEELIAHMTEVALAQTQHTKEIQDLKKGKEASDLKLLTNKARQSDTIIPVLQWWQSLKDDQRTRIKASGTLEQIRQIYNETTPSSSTTTAMDTSPPPSDTTTPPSTSEEALPPTLAHQLFDEMTENTRERGRQAFDPNKGQPNTQIAQMLSRMAEMEKKNRALEDILIQQNDAKEEKEEALRQKKLAALASARRAPPPVPMKTSVKASAATAPQRVSQKKVEDKQKAAIALMRKAKAAAAAAGLDEEEEEEQPQQEEEPEEEEFKDEAPQQEEEEEQKEDRPPPQDGDEDMNPDNGEKDEVVDIDDEQFGDLDLGVYRGDSSAAGFHNSAHFNRNPKYQTNDGGKRRRQDPSQVQLQISKQATERYKKKLAKVKPEAAARIKVSASGTTGRVGVQVTPGMLREQYREGRAYTWLMNPRLDRSISQADLDDMHTQAQIGKGVRMDEGTIDQWTVGRCKDDGDWARTRMVTVANDRFSQRYRERDPGVRIGGIYT